MIPEASVIIPTYDEWEILQNCLDCLTQQSVAQDRFEVIVANNNASSDVPATLRLPPNARVIHVPKPGSYAARNAAIRQARADVLFFTDSDCLPDNRWIEAGLAAITPLGQNARIAGHVVVFPKGNHWTVAELYDRVQGARQEEYAQDGWCITANLVARRAAFDHVGLFDEERFSGGDREWSNRASKMGCEIVFGPDAVVRHPARSSFADLAKKRRRLTGGRYQAELLGLSPKRSLTSGLLLVTKSEVHNALSHPGLTEYQRLQFLGVCFCLGFIAFVETVRLRYLSGQPTRS